MRVSHPIGCAAILFMTWVMVSPAWGHGIDLFARVEGEQIVGTLAFADGTPVQNAPVRALAPDGVVIETAHTGADGRFVMPLRFRITYQLVGDGGQGHLGRYTVAESEIPAHLPKLVKGDGADDGTAPHVHDVPGTVDSAALEGAIARQLGPLREQLFEHDRKLRLRDLIGGIGYIFGVAGLYVLVQQRRARS